MKDFRERWATMESVEVNNTLQEDWHDLPDSSSEWSHCPVAPLFVTTMSLAGIQPLHPGFESCEIRPQLADLELLELTVHTVRGPIGLSSRGRMGKCQLTLALPSGCVGELVVSSKEKLGLEPLSGPAHAGHVRYRLAANKTTTVDLKFT